MDTNRQRGDHSDSHRNPHSFPDDPAKHNDRNSDGHRRGSSGDYGHRHRPHNHPDHRNNPNFKTDHNSGSGNWGDNGSHQSSSTPWRKRSFSHSSHGSSQDCPEGGSYVKLYVRNVPRDTSDDEIRSLFMEYGDVAEVVQIWDKMTGQQQEYCFVKYGKVEDGDRAIKALDTKYTFLGGVLPIKVRYADGESERLGALLVQKKLYVGCLNKKATEEEIHEVFSPYGHIVQIYIVRDELRQSRGCGFIHFDTRAMAVAAMTALNGNFTMKGCDQPLIVRFADPKKPRIGEPRPPPYFNDQGRPMPPVASHQFSPNTMTSSSQSRQTSLGKQHSVPSTYTTSELGFTSPSSATTVPAQAGNLLECDWSEHTCPDGYKYYYNCVTCESLWEKPEEYSRFEQQMQTLQAPQQQQQTSSQEVYPPTKLPLIPTREFSQMQQELNGLQVQARTSPIVGQTCV